MSATDEPSGLPPPSAPLKVTPSTVLLPLACLAVGALLVYLGLRRGWGNVWAAGGGFFVAVGIATSVLTLAWTLPGRAGAFLRHPAISLVLVVAIVVMLFVTVVLGIFL